MNDIQKKLLSIIIPSGFGRITLSELGSKVGVSNRQKVKYHLDSLEEEGYIEVGRKDGAIIKIVPKISDSNLVSLPIYGSVNCGVATIFAEENFEGYLKISKKLLSFIPSKNHYALKASGDSMNKAKILGKKSIEDGDFIIVDSGNQSPNNEDYVVSVIDMAANVKKFVKKVDRIELRSEAMNQSDYPPIFIHPEDDYIISGVVVDVVKMD